jgi:DNA repair protein RadA/Sms
MARDAKTLYSLPRLRRHQPEVAGPVPALQAPGTRWRRRWPSPPRGAGKNRFQALARSQPVATLSEIEAADVERTPTGQDELDRVLGGGIVAGGVVLIGGDPGIGKSTLLLQALDAVSHALPVLYVTGEESGAQVALRARRLGLAGQRVRVLAEIQLERIVATLEAEAPAFCVIDSIQTLYSEQLELGARARWRRCASARRSSRAWPRRAAAPWCWWATSPRKARWPARACSSTSSTRCCTSRATRTRSFRLVRAIKNRFGAVNEIGVFAMTERGLKGVSQPERHLPVHARRAGARRLRAGDAGGHATAAGGGAGPGGQPAARARGGCPWAWTATAWRMLLAVLHRHAGVACMDQDVFVNAVGGVRIGEPAADLAVLLAITSSLRGRALPRGFIAFGEVGLAGEVRPAPRGQERLREAAKLGFQRGRGAARQCAEEGPSRA